LFQIRSPVPTNMMRSVAGWRNRFSLSSQFLIAAALVLCLAMAVFGSWVNRQITRSVLATSGAAGVAFMNAFIEPVIQDIQADGTLPAQSHEALDALLVGSPIGKIIVSVKIWRSDGTVIYTTAFKDVIGDRFVSTDVAKAVSGQVVAEFGDMKSSESAYEQGLSMPLIEVYAPLYRTGTKEIIAVGEIYENAAALALQLRVSQFRTWLVVCLTTLMMLAFLYSIVRRGSQTIDAQRTELQERVTETQRMAMQNETLRIAAEQTRMDANEANEELIGRIGLDLHDGPIQLLSLLMLRLGKLRPTGHLAEDEKNRTSVHELTANIIDELRVLSTGLVLPEISDLTPTQAIELAVDRHVNLTGSNVDLELGALPKQLPAALMICIYRIVQESLSNSFKHAGGAGQRVRAGQVDDIISLEISDDGGGLADVPVAPGSSRGLGIRGIRNRVQAFNGTVDIRSSPSGVQVSIKLPINTRASVAGGATRLNTIN